MAGKVDVENGPEDIQAIQLAIGFVVFQWAHIEVTLDVLVTVSLFLEGNRTRGEHVPRNLKNKIQHLRKYFNKVEALHPYRDEALKLLDRISQQKDMRHDLAHSILKRHTHDNGVFTFKKIEPSAPRGTREWTLDVRDFEVKGMALKKLQVDTVNFGLKIHEAFNHRLEEQWGK